LLCSGVGQITSQRIGQALHINEATLLEMEGDEPPPLPATIRLPGMRNGSHVPTFLLAGV